MSQLPDQLLAWLWEKSQTYQLPRIVYNDIAATISRFPSLQPRTASYTFEYGHQELLLCLAGTVASDFRGAQYRYPIEIWIPRQYGQPGVAIVCYVKPGAGKDGSVSDMAVRPGQHVSVDGKVYHPYLRDWGIAERSTVATFVQILQSVFAREPPIVAKPQQAPPIPPHPSSQQNPVLPPKGKPSRDGVLGPSSPSQGSRPPPLPSKPGNHQSPLDRSESAAAPQQNGPPLPPLPHEQARPQYQHHMNGRSPSAPQVSHHREPPQLRPIERQQMPPPLSEIPTKSQYQQTSLKRSPISPLTPGQRAELSGSRYDRSGLPVQSQQPYNMPYRQHPAPQGPPQYQQPHQYQSGPPPQQTINGQQYQQPRQQFMQPPQAQPKPPAPAQDLLSDPFDISLSIPTRAGPPPPIPPNPEKEHLLQLQSQAFVAQAQAKVQQAQTAIGPLTAQRQALLEAQSRLQSELHSLRALDQTLTTNENILHQSMRDCQSVIESGRNMPKPNIDELLIAPTVAAQQLWTLCAEEAGIREALWCLQQGVGAGRISGGEFVRLTRSLAREAFLKMALMRKIARGLGLEVPTKGGQWEGFG